MSTWTHVVGTIRVDGIPGGEENLDSTLPAGSEGSLRYSINEYGGGLPWVIITIWGDLRDYDINDAEEIKVWWKELLPKFDIVRDAVLLVTSNEDSFTLYHSKP